MSRDKNQIFIFNDRQISLIKNTFADNEDLLYMVRKVLLQFPLNDFEKRMIKSSINQDVWEVLKMRIFPEINESVPLTQLSDIYQTLTNDLKTKTVEEMAPLFEAKQIEIDYLNQQFEALKDIEADVDQSVKLDQLASLKGKSATQTYIDTVARNFLLGYIDPMLNLIKNIAGQKNETVEQAKNRMSRDSSK